MKKIMLFSIAWFFNQLASGQDHAYSFPEIGFSFSPPTGYTLVDSAVQTFYPDTTQQVRIKKFYFRSGKNALFFSLIKNSGKDQGWDTIYRKETRHLIEAIRRNKPSNIYESDTSDILLDSLLFHAIRIKGWENGRADYFHTGLYNYYKGYRIHISFTYRNEEDALLFEKAVKESKFID